MIPTPRPAKRFWAIMLLLATALVLNWLLGPSTLMASSRFIGWTGVAAMLGFVVFVASTSFGKCLFLTL